MATKNTRLLNAIQHQPVDKIPVWLMRQAGRYLPEYRKLRKEAGSFMQLCKTPELACEITLQPLARFDLDAAIIFSDILVIPDAMGLDLSFIEKKGPQFTHRIDNEQAVNALKPLDEANLTYVYDAIRLVKKALSDRIPLIGFCGSPWTLAAYMTEGEAKNGFPTIMTMLKNAPHLLHQLLTHMSQAVAQHCLAQVHAGCDVIMIFDTWGSLLTKDKDRYQAFSLNYIQQIIQTVRSQTTTPFILFTRHASCVLEQLAASGCQVVGLDWEISLSEAKARVGHQVALQGNLNPSYLLQEPTIIEGALKNIFEAYNPGFIFNLGHGVTPETPPEHVSFLVDTVHAFQIN